MCVHDQQTPYGAIKHRKSAEPEVAQQPKLVLQDPITFGQLLEFVAIHLIKALLWMPFSSFSKATKF